MFQRQKVNRRNTGDINRDIAGEHSLLGIFNGGEDFNLGVFEKPFGEIHCQGILNRANFVCGYVKFLEGFDLLGCLLVRCQRDAPDSM